MKQNLLASFKRHLVRKNRSFLKETPAESRAHPHPSYISKGFSIVEITIVIVVIAIIVAIVVVSYNNVEDSSHDITLKADLDGAAKILGSNRAFDGSFPDSIQSADGGKGLKKNATTNFTYSTSGSHYCLTATSNKLPDLSYYYNSEAGEIKEGVCTGHNNGAVVYVSTVAGSNAAGMANGSGDEVRFNFFNANDNNYGFGIDVDGDETLYIADTGNNQIRRINGAGQVTTFAGATGDSGEIITTAASATRFNYPMDVTIATIGGQKQLLVPTQHCLRTINLDVSPYASGIINGGILDFHDEHLECTYMTNTGTVPANSAAFMSPVSTIHDSSGNLFVNEASSGKLRRMTFNSGSNSWASVLNLTSAGSFGYDSRFGVDAQNNGYGVKGNAVMRFNSGGSVSTFAGNSASGYADGKSANARFNNPRGVDVDSNGNVYVADCVNHRIRKVTPSGYVTTLAGAAEEGHRDGIGSVARFGCPSDVAVSADGETLYVIDIAAGTNLAGYIRKLTLNVINYN